MAAATVARKGGLRVLIGSRDIMILPFVFAAKTHDACFFPSPCKQASELR